MSNANQAQPSKFWIVWNEEGALTRNTHPTPERAVEEAERLARSNPGASYVVLEAVTRRKVDPMVRENYSAGLQNVSLDVAKFPSEFSSLVLGRRL